MNSLRIAFIPLVRIQFDVPLAEQMIQTARHSLLSAGFTLVGPEQPISDLPSAQAAVEALASTPVDLTLVFQATFADSTMVTTLAEGIHAPLFLWAVPEPWSGERLRLNSLCGINLAGHALTLRKISYQYAYAAPDDPSVIAKLRPLAAAGSLRRQLSAARLGVVGEHPNGMDTCILDEETLQRLFGVQIHRVDLQQVFKRARSTSAEAIQPVRTSLDALLKNLDTLEQQPLTKTISVFNVLKEIVAEEKLDGLAVRCWPEFFTDLGCAACGALSLLSGGFEGAAPVPCSCEADINGTLTQLLLQRASGAAAFGTDIVAADYAQNTVALWHCGMAPISMADPSHPLKGGLHSNRKVPLIMDFRLKPGMVTVARITQSSGSLRLVLGSGEIIPAPKPFSGSAGTIRFSQSAEQFVDLLMQQGLEHHVSITYGDYQAELNAFASLIGLPVVRF